MGDKEIYRSPIKAQAALVQNAVVLDELLNGGEWQNAYSFTFDRSDLITPGVIVFGEPKADTTVCIQRSEDRLYAAVDVVDSALDFSSSPNLWENDSVELHVDGNLSFLTGKEQSQFGFQAVVLGNGSQSGGQNALTPVMLSDGGYSSNNGRYWNFGARAKAGGTGYIVEYSIDLNAIRDTVDRNIIGFDIAINNGNGTDSRAGKYAWNYTNQNGTVQDWWNDETGWGQLLLVEQLQDIMPPVIAFESEVFVEANQFGGAVIQYEYISVHDNEDLSPLIEFMPPTGSFLPKGQHAVLAKATDASSNASVSSFLINVVDTTPPVITLNGDDTVFIECHVDNYVEPGASASDICDASVKVVIGGGAIDTNSLGAYTVTYTAQDLSGNIASTTRAVVVHDTQPPVITLNGAPLVTLECGVDSYTEFGAEAIDACDPNIQVVISGDAVNPNRLDNYVVQYSAQDSSGNITGANRIVVVQDTLPPEIVCPPIIVADVKVSLA